MTTKKCDFCPTIAKIKHLKKINGNLMCNDCYKERLKERREKLEKSLGITEEQKLKEDNLIKRNDRKKYREKNRTQSKKGSNKLHFYLTKLEKDLLYRKYIKKGLSSLEARNLLKSRCGYLSELVKKLKEKKLSEEEININFKKEFARMVENEIK